MKKRVDFNKKDKSKSIQNVWDRYHNIDITNVIVTPSDKRWLAYFIGWVIDNVDLVEN